MSGKPRKSLQLRIFSGQCRGILVVSSITSTLYRNSSPNSNGRLGMMIRVTVTYFLYVFGQWSNVTRLRTQKRVLAYASVTPEKLFMLHHWHPEVDSLNIRVHCSLTAFQAILRDEAGTLGGKNTYIRYLACFKEYQLNISWNAKSDDSSHCLPARKLLFKESNSESWDIGIAKHDKSKQQSYIILLSSLYRFLVCNLNILSQICFPTACFHSSRIDPWSFGRCWGPVVKIFASADQKQCCPEHHSREEMDP